MYEDIDEFVNSYVYKPTLIPIYDHGTVATTVPFVANLNIAGEPAYNNEGCNIGLVRIKKGKYRNRLVLMYEDEFWPQNSNGKFITENEAYELCCERGKHYVVKKYDIRPDYENE